MRMSFWAWLGITAIVGYMLWQTTQDQKSLEKDLAILEKK